MRGDGDVIYGRPPRGRRGPTRDGLDLQDSSAHPIVLSHRQDANHMWAIRHRQPVASTGVQSVSKDTVHPHSSGSGVGRRISSSSRLGMYYTRRCDALLFLATVRLMSVTKGRAATCSSNKPSPPLLPTPTAPPPPPSAAHYAYMHCNEKRTDCLFPQTGLH